MNCRATSWFDDSRAAVSAAKRLQESIKGQQIETLARALADNFFAGQLGPNVDVSAEVDCRWHEWEEDATRLQEKLRIIQILGR